ncbi:hypothetical protein DHEL01_v211282 [Diaporthe helianthi]|uniref:Uncharacterized protein n=1 Tax=Diaporthe helianthi TaxID=158607 RepID=A0A2P5HJA4_DIAHE|nr:hypothetical protein DHEL01_v211282 [Diaporthe helianthi]
MFLLFMLRLLSITLLSTPTWASPPAEVSSSNLMSRNAAGEINDMSDKYPGKYWNLLAEAAEEVEYPASKSLRKRGYYVVCDGNSVVDNHRCEAQTYCDSDGDLDALAPTPGTSFKYCADHCKCENDNEIEVRTPTPTICGMTYCNTEHTWCLQDGTRNGCGAVTITRSRNKAKNKVKGRLEIHHEYGRVTNAQFEMGSNHEVAVVHSASLGALAVFFIFF